MRWTWGVAWLFAFTTAIHAQGSDNREAATVIICFPKKFLKTEADPISATLIRYGVSKETDKKACRLFTERFPEKNSTVESNIRILRSLPCTI